MLKQTLIIIAALTFVIAFTSADDIQTMDGYGSDDELIGFWAENETIFHQGIITLSPNGTQAPPTPPANDTGNVTGGGGGGGPPSTVTDFEYAIELPARVFAGLSFDVINVCENTGSEDVELTCINYVDLNNNNQLDETETYTEFNKTLAYEEIATIKTPLRLPYNYKQGDYQVVGECELAEQTEQTASTFRLISPLTPVIIIILNTILATTLTILIVFKVRERRKKKRQKANKTKK